MKTNNSQILSLVFGSVMIFLLTVNCKKEENSLDMTKPCQNEKTSLYNLWGYIGTNSSLDLSDSLRFNIFIGSDTSIYGTWSISNDIITFFNIYQSSTTPIHPDTTTELIVKLRCDTLSLSRIHPPYGKGVVASFVITTR